MSKAIIPVLTSLALGCLYFIPSLVYMLRVRRAYSFILVVGSAALALSSLCNVLTDVYRDAFTALPASTQGYILAGSSFAGVLGYLLFGIGFSLMIVTLLKKHNKASQVTSQ